MEFPYSVPMPASKVAFIFVGLFFLAACNFFDPFRSPSGTAAIFSAARGCLDRGDLECARREYAKLAGTPEAEVAASELAFTLLEEAGAGASSLFPSLAKGSSSGAKLTLLANKLYRTRGQTARKLIYEAYLKVEDIPSNTNLRGLVRFTSGFALAAAILAEEIGTSGELKKTDYLLNLACDRTICATDAQCDGPQPRVVAGATITLTASPLPALAVFDVEFPTWGMYQAALNGVQLGVSEVAATGDLTAGTGDLALSFSTIVSDAAGADRCFRAENMGQDIGAHL